MPTGYTAKIKDDITFNGFVWGCARSMGALIMMRDEPDAPIPDRFEPSDFYTKQLKVLNTKLQDLQNMSAGDAMVAAKKDHTKKTRHDKKYMRDNLALESKYKRMLAKVNGWVPPTNDHTNLKNFMIEQLNSSISFDCRAIPEPAHDLLDGPEWLHKTLGKLLEEISRLKARQQNDIGLTEERNIWLARLRNSLKLYSDIIGD